MTRAAGAFRKAGLDVLPRPFPDAIKRSATRFGRWEAFIDVARETMGLVYYRWKGWV